jgi:hypothetical protein
LPGRENAKAVATSKTVQNNIGGTGRPGANPATNSMVRFYNKPYFSLT